MSLIAWFGFGFVCGLAGVALVLTIFAAAESEDERRQEALRQWEEQNAERPRRHSPAEHIQHTLEQRAAEQDEQYRARLRALADVVARNRAAHVMDRRTQATIRGTIIGRTTPRRPAPRIEGNVADAIIYDDMRP